MPFYSQSARGNAELIIRSVSKDTAGVYAAIAYNLVGDIRSTCTVAVTDELSTGPARRPKFTQVPESMSTTSGTRVVLEAQAIGEPMPEFKWDKDGLELLPDTQLPHAVIESDGEGHTRLVIKSTERSDEGLYRCTAFNKVGRCKRGAFVWINGEFSSFSKLRIALKRRSDVFQTTVFRSHRAHSRVLVSARWAPAQGKCRGRWSFRLSARTRRCR